MSQNRLVGLALLVAGAIALYFGINAANSPTGEVAEALTGQYPDRTMVYLVGGAVAAAAGIAMLWKGR